MLACGGMDPDVCGRVSVPTLAVAFRPAQSRRGRQRGRGLAALAVGGASGVAAGLAAAVVELRQRAELQPDDLQAEAAAVLAVARWRAEVRGQLSASAALPGRSYLHRRAAGCNAASWGGVASRHTGAPWPPPPSPPEHRSPDATGSRGDRRWWCTETTPPRATPGRRPGWSSSGGLQVFRHTQNETGTQTRTQAGTQTGTQARWAGPTHLGRPLQVRSEALAPLASWQ